MVNYPEELTRHTHKQGTVKGSLVYNFSSPQVDYLVSHGRYVARTHGPILYGTTANEAFHAQVKRYFNNKTGFTRAYARTAARTFQLGHVLRSSLKRSTVRMSHRRPQDLEAAAWEFITQSKFRLRPHLGAI